MNVVFHILSALFVIVALATCMASFLSPQSSLGTISFLAIGAIFAVFARMAQASAHRASDDIRREKAGKE